jgi:hypothetical protein
MKDAQSLARLVMWLAILGLATLVVGAVMGRIQAEVKA